MKTAPVLLLITLCACASPADRVDQRPNVVFFMIDDLGWKDVGFMGSSYYETPNIDALAAQGMVFTSAYSNAPNCAPTRAALMSGQYAPRHGIYTVGSSERGESRFRQLIPVPNTTTLDTSIVTMAEMFRAGGYATGHFGKWHLGRAGFFPEDQGFDVNAGGHHSGSPPGGHFSPYKNPKLKDGPDGEYLTDRLTNEALSFIDQHNDQPFFLYLSHYAVHTPIQAKEDLIEKYTAKPGEHGQDNPTYAAMVQSVDESVGAILAKLDALQLTDNTIVVFYSDNGGYGPATSMSPLRGAKGMLYEGGIRVPLIVKWPGEVEAGATNDMPVISIDLYPTFQQVAGVKSEQLFDGENLLPLLKGNTDAFSRQAIYWHFPAYLEAYRDQKTPWRITPSGAIRMGSYKLIQFFGEETVELYNLDDDIGEQENLVEMMPEKARALKEALRTWREEVNAPVPVEQNPEFDRAAYEAALFIGPNALN